MGSLLLTSYEQINPIFVSSVGLLSQLLSIFKHLFDNPQSMIVESVKVDDLPNRPVSRLIKSLSTVFQQNDIEDE